MAVQESIQFGDERLPVDFWKRVEIKGDCWEWVGARTGRYGCLRLWGKYHRAHRLSYSTLVGNLPDELQVCHHCDNPPCINPAHLFTGSLIDNMRDSRLKGRKIGLSQGVKHGMAKLTEQAVIDIRRDALAGMGGDLLSVKYGCSKTQIYRILSRENWRHVGGPPAETTLKEWMDRAEALKAEVASLTAELDAQRRARLKSDVEVERLQREVADLRGKIAEHER